MAKLFHLFGPIKWYRQRPIWPGNHLTVCPKTPASPKPILPLTQSSSAILTNFHLFCPISYVFVLYLIYFSGNSEFLGRSVALSKWGKLSSAPLREASWSPETFVTGVVVTGNRSNWTTVGTTYNDCAAQCSVLRGLELPELPELPEHGDEKMRRFELWDSHG